MALELTEEQAKVRDYVLEALKGGKRLVTTGGYAGTGKTTLVSETVQHFRKEARIEFRAFTGKAASVLRRKLTTAGIGGSNYGIGTLHSLIYDPIFGHRGQICGFTKKPSIDASLVILDEASMVDEILFKDLVSFGVPIWAVGDHGQLPPVMGRFNLMENPEIKLEKIHRQAENDPIIKMSILAREEGYIPPGVYGEFARKTTDKDEFYKLDWADIRTASKAILCGRNDTRNKINLWIRKKIGLIASDLAGEILRPLISDRVICLKNNRDEGIYNGMSGTILSCEDSANDHYWIRIKMDYEELEYYGRVFKPQFGASKTIREWKDLEANQIGDQFDFGYCLTTHKSQGSEWNSVILIEERFSSMTDDDWRRWLYTAVTRAKEKILIFGS